MVVEAHDYRAQTGGIDEIHLRQIQHQLANAVGHGRRHGLAQCGGFRAHRDAAFHIEDGDTLAFLALNFERHDVGTELRRAS
jgi:hypothetical protein